MSTEFIDFKFKFINNWWWYFVTNGDRIDNIEANLEIRTDRSLFHPGEDSDSLKWQFVAIDCGHKRDVNQLNYQRLSVARQSCFYGTEIRFCLETESLRLSSSSINDTFECVLPILYLFDIDSILLKNYTVKITVWTWIFHLIKRLEHSNRIIKMYYVLRIRFKNIF